MIAKFVTIAIEEQTISCSENLMVFTLSSHDIEKFGLPRAQLK